jgi:glucan biosynthesis protein C
MLLLGIPFHVSEIYRVSGHFSISSTDTSYIASLLSALIHSFRMPAFFLLSGYFAAMLIVRQGSSRWIKSRYLKLGIPLVATTLTLGLLEETLATFYMGHGSFIQSAREVLNGSVVDWVGARWFLVTLILFCTTLVVVQSHIPRLVDTGRSLAESQRMRKGLILAGLLALLLVPFVAIFAGKICGEWFISSPALKSYAINYVKYIAFFGTGVVLFYLPDGMPRFVRLSYFDFAMLGVSMLIYIATYFAFYGPSFAANYPLTSKLFGVAWNAVEVITGYFAAKGFFAIMAKVFTRESGVIAYFVDASFCIYLVHETFFLIAGGYYLNVSLAPVVEMAVICAFTLLGSVGVYEVARRVPGLEWPLNGGPFRFAATSRRRDAHS